MKTYWDTLSKSERATLANKVKSTTGYLRLVFKGHKKASFILAQRIEEVTCGSVTKSELRPDIYGKFSGDTSAALLPNGE
ncbi:YdaS family helix-turn-helix protein [Erwinia persicina]|uniref:YdaS family helix-turn-helix protein n=1 Tax=Erwinia persicina TaxID=55211 RepID=UPI000786AAA4|nr:YdaS family helix-turn-helix protein [Erwinia persicina]